MASNDRNDPDGPDGEVVEGSWSPRRKASTKAPKAKDAPPPDPAALAEEIEKTREELAETLDAIAEKVSPKRVASRTRKKVGDAVKGGTNDATEAVKGGVAAVKEKVSGETAPAPTTGALADTAYTPVEPAGAETPAYPSVLPPAAASKLPMVAGAAAALLVVLLIMRRRRR